MTDDPTLDEALDGLLTAAAYCEDIGEEFQANTLNELYQWLGRVAPDDDWDDVSDDHENTWREYED